MNKKEMLMMALESFSTDRIQEWYARRMQGDTQGNTLEVLTAAIRESELVPLEALTIAFIVGLQWKDNFE